METSTLRLTTTNFGTSTTAYTNFTNPSTTAFNDTNGTTEFTNTNGTTAYTNGTIAYTNGTTAFTNSNGTTASYSTTSVPSTIELLTEIATAIINNCSETSTIAPPEPIPPLPMWEVIVKVIPLTIIILMVVLGNLLVIIAVLTQRALRTPPNFLIASLALADLTVGVFILPLNVIEMMLNGQWMFGKTLCRIWLTSDVTLCSTSILHISAIAVDRYRSINEGINYISQRTIRTAVGICVCLWVIALWIASAPVLGWNDWANKDEHECVLPSNIGYIIHSASGAFFLPAIVMVIVYVKIFFLIKQRLKDRAKLSSVVTEPSQEDSSDLTEDEKRKTNKRKYSEQIGEILKSKMRFSLTKERKAAQTLGIIIGSFIVCWTPFTLTYMTNGILMELGMGAVNIHFFRFVTWLGYVNSALNPPIYTFYNPEFRRAFKRILRLGTSNSIRKPFTVSTINRA